MNLDGRTLGEFTLKEKIGEGGFAVVHRAEQAALERDAVVKVLHERFAGRADVAQRFLREARLASRIDHPYAAHVYAFGAEPDGTLWIAMELVRGTPMDKLLEARGPLVLEQFVSLFERICEVVQNAHDHGIVHRDLKPGNVMVIERGGRLLPKLLDFGIARALDDLEVPALKRSTPKLAVDPMVTTDWVEAEPSRDATRRGQVMGSPAYMAPEQWIDATSVGPASDIYALGVMAFQALSGRLPFPGTSAEVVLAAHLEAPPPALGDRFSAAVDAVIARALAKRPLDRYATANDLATAMRTAAGLDDGILPQLDARHRDATIANAVQPLAEAVAALDSARNLDQASALIWDVTTVAIRWVGILALASRGRAGPGAETDGEAVRERLRLLGRGRLDDDEWLELARELVRPFADKHDVHPLPALVTMLGSSSGFAARYRQLAELRSRLDRRAGRLPEERRSLYREALAALGDLLAALEPLAAYTMVVPRGGRDEHWRGVRRSPRAATSSSLVDGDVVLVDREHSPVLHLGPLVQVARPAPNRDEEMFVFDGKGSRNARLVAMPYGFERADPNLDDWLRAELGALAEEPAVDATDVPYRGLEVFTEEHADDYVGREREVEVFVNRVIVEPLLAVVGPSGSGKSSFVRAGVIPNLPAGWRAIVVRPGGSPLAALEAHLRAAGVDVPELADDPGALADALRATAERESATLVLVIDQLEELFTLCRDDRVRAVYAAALADATRTEADPIRVVVTLRDDFLVRVGTLPVFGGRLARGLQLLATPAPDDLERTLVEPARRAGYEFEDPALAGEMVDAVASQPGALALLSFTAAELWKLRDRQFRQLTRKAYLAIGGVGGALARHAESMLKAMSPEDQRLVRVAFRNLVTVEGTRQVLTSAELHQLLARPSERGRAEAVVDRLIDARLVVSSEDVGGVTRIEVIHEALLAAWPRLVEWRREDAEGARLRDQLRASARQWDARGRPRGLLWRDDALAEYRIWRARHAGAMTDLDEAFGAASLADATRKRRIRNTLLVTAFVVLGVGATVLFQLRALAEERATEIAAQLTESNIVRGQQALLGGDYLAARDALRLIEGPAATPAVRFMLARAADPLEAEVATLVGPGGQLNQVAFSPDGSRILTAGLDPIAMVWDIEGKRLASLEGHARGGIAAAWSPDGEHIATLDAGGTLRLWTKDGVLHATTPGQPTYVRVLAYRGDGARIAAAGVSGVTVWEGRSGKRLDSWVVDPLGSGSVAFSAGGDTVLASGLSGRVAIWTLEGKLVRELQGHTSAVWFANFAGTRIVTCSLDTTARIWDANTGLSLHVLRAHEGRVTHVAVDPSGRYVATTSADATARVWRLETGELVSTLRGHTAEVFWAAWSNDGQLVTTSADGTVRLWDPLRGLPTAVFLHGGFVAQASVSRSGRHVVTAAWSGSAKIWDLSRQTRLVTLSDPITTTTRSDAKPPSFSSSRLVRYGTSGLVAWDLERALSRHVPTAARAWSRKLALTAGTMSDDGRQIVAGDATGVVHVIDAATGAPLRQISVHRGPVLDVAIHEGRAATTADGTVAISDLATGRKLHERALGSITAIVSSRTGAVFAYPRAPDDQTLRTGWLMDRDLGTVRPLVHDDAIIVATFAPDGRLTTTSSGGKVQIWNLDGSLAVSLTHGSPVGGLAWSGDGSVLVTGGDDGTIRLWNPTTGAQIATADAHASYITSIAFAPSGAFFVTSGADHVVKIWATAPLRLVSRFGMGNNFVDQVRFDGEHLITSDSTHTDVWDASD